MRRSRSCEHSLEGERRRSESNRRIEVLQTSALPLGYGARASIVTKTRRFLNPAGLPSVLPRGRVPVDPAHPDARCLRAVARPGARALSATVAVPPPWPRPAALGDHRRDSRDAQDLAALTHQPGA